MTDRYIEPAVQRLLNVIGLSGEYRAGSVRLVGEDPVVPSRSRLGLASAAALAAQGAAIATIWHEMTGEKQDVRVDVRQAANPGLRTCAVLRQNGHTLRQPGPPDEENNFFITRDGRRIYLLRTSLQQKHRGRLLAFLGCSDGTTSALAEAVRHWDSLELEDALADQKLIGVIARPRAEWLSHPQGQWLNSRPPVSIEKIAESEPEPFSRTARPLSGLRVLDMAHVLAGPICSRVLAEQGADVLHVSSPHDRDASYIELDTMFGKRASYIDLNRASDETRLWELIKSCDVFAHSWRPGSLERRGLSMERMAACRPGIIFVSVSCYGYGGPWMTRGGYEPLGQTACGLVLDEGTMDEPLLAPTYTLNDYLAGYLAAAGVLGALIRRAHEGGSYHVHVSLTRCSMWVQELGLLEQNKWPTRDARSKLPELRESDLMSTETVFGMVDHAAPITHYSNSRAYWARPPVPPGANQASWLPR